MCGCFEYLTGDELLRVTSTCKTWLAYGSTNWVWKNILKQEFPWAAARPAARQVMEYRRVAFLRTPRWQALGFSQEGLPARLRFASVQTVHGKSFNILDVNAGVSGLMVLGGLAVEGIVRGGRLINMDTNISKPLHVVNDARPLPKGRYGHTMTPLDVDDKQCWAATSALVLFGRISAPSDGRKVLSDRIWRITANKVEAKILAQREAEKLPLPLFTFELIHPISQMRPVARFLHAACRLPDSSILVSGGQDCYGYVLHDMWRLTRSAQGDFSWEPLNVTIDQRYLRRFGHSMTLVGSTVYICGGGVGELVMLNVANMSWSTRVVGLDLNPRCRFLTALPFGRHLLIMGARLRNESERHFNRYATLS